MYEVRGGGSQTNHRLTDGSINMFDSVALVNMKVDWYIYHASLCSGLKRDWYRLIQMKVKWAVRQHWQILIRYSSTEPNIKHNTSNWNMRGVRGLRDRKCQPGTTGSWCEDSDFPEHSLSNHILDVPMNTGEMCVYLWGYCVCVSLIIACLLLPLPFSLRGNLSSCLSP